MRNSNLAGLLADRALEAGWYDRPAYYAPDVVTHRQIHDGGARLAEVLRNRGLSRGDRVLLCLPDSPDLVQLLLACLNRGAVAFLANPDLHREEHAFQERDTEPALVVTSTLLRDRFEPLRVVEAAELLSEATRVEPGERESVGSDVHAYATYTSGSTGPPKAAIHRHADPLIVADAVCRNALRLTPEDIGLGSARMDFTYGLGNSVWFPLATGSSAVISRLPVSAEQAAMQCARFGASVLYGVPTFFARIVDKCSPESFRSLRCVVSAGEALEIALAERMLEFFGGIPILDGIGSTEVGHMFLSNSVDEWRLGTLGKVLPPFEIRVASPDGTTSEPGVEGDLLVRGSSITPGYWNRSEPLTGIGGWLNTRDRVCIDGEGWVTYLCRADDTEIVGGVNVNPREIERLIIEHDAVAEAAVVGVKESTGVSALQAFLVPRTSAFIDESVMRDIHRRLLNQLSSFKVPHRFSILDRLPRTSNGKLTRNALRSESPAKPIWELPSIESQSGAEAQRDKRPATIMQIVGNVGGLTLTERLAALEQERHRLVLEAVCAEAATVLGESDPWSVNRDLAFAELGFDSQMTVGLCRRLATATGLRIPDTVGWDCGSISGLARYLDAALSGRERAAALCSSAHSWSPERSALEQELTNLEPMVMAIEASEKQLVADRLRALLRAVSDGEGGFAKRIQAASTPDEVFQLIDSEFGEPSNEGAT